MSNKNDFDQLDYYRWLAESKDKQKAELSDYWHDRAKRRAKTNGRRYPNKIDEAWALEQYEKSKQMESAFKNLEMEMSEAEEGLSEAKGKMKAKLKPFGPKVKSEKTPYSGQTKGGKNFPFDDKSRLGRTKAFKARAKKVPAVAPGEAFGPMEEQSPITGPSPVSSTTVSAATTTSQKSPEQAIAEANAAITKAQGVIKSATTALNQIISGLTTIK
jgi:hypothetical protein